MLWGPDDWDALTLDRSDAMYRPSLLDEALRQILDKLPLRRRKTAADLGCGSGALLPFLADRFEAVVAIDYAPASLARARELYGAENVRFRRRDLRDLTPFRNRFHVAMALDSILGPRTVDVDRILEQVRRTLKEGGILLATFPAALRSGEPIEMAHAPGSIPEEPCRFHEVELQYRLRKAGYQGVRIRRLRTPGDDPDSLLCLAINRANN